LGGKTAEMPEFGLRNLSGRSPESLESHTSFLLTLLI